MEELSLTLNNKPVLVLRVTLPGAPLLVGRGSQGFVMCGYLDIATAEKLHVAAAIVRGVDTPQDLLDRPVTQVSSAAATLGVKVGQSGREALTLLA